MIKKIKTISKDSFYYVDPTRFALVSLRVEGRILLHKLQARAHMFDFISFRIKTKTPEIGGICLTRRGSAVYANSTFWSHYIKPTNLVNNDFVDNFLC